MGNEVSAMGNEVSAQSRPIPADLYQALTGHSTGAHRHKTLAAICWTIPRHTATGHRTSASKTEIVRCVGLVNKAGV
jgi:hypothetical protein